MRKFLTGILLPLLVILSGCGADTVTEADGYSTVPALAEIDPSESGSLETDGFIGGLPSELDVTSGGIEVMPSEEYVTTIYVPDGDSHEQTSAGKMPTDIEITEVYTSVTPEPEEPQSFTNPWEERAVIPWEAEEAVNTSEYGDFSARIAAVDETSVTAAVLTEEWRDIFGSFIIIKKDQLESLPDCAPGDTAEVIRSGDIKVHLGKPPIIYEGISEIKVTESTGLEISENGTLSAVVDVLPGMAADGEHYIMVVKAFGLRGYGFGAEIFIPTLEEFAVGDWAIIEFAEDTLFMETAPMQVLSECVLSVERIS